MNDARIAKELVKVARELTAGDTHYELWRALNELEGKIVAYRETMRQKGESRESDMFYLDSIKHMNAMKKTCRKYS